MHLSKFLTIEITDIRVCLLDMYYFYIMVNNHLNQLSTNTWGYNPLLSLDNVQNSSNTNNNNNKKDESGRRLSYQELNDKQKINQDDEKEPSIDQLKPRINHETKIKFLIIWGDSG